jgi:ribosomal protein L31
MKKFMDFGQQPLANAFLNEEDFDSEKFYHLELYFCEFCYSVQIGECPRKEDVFNGSYPFYTSTSKFMEQHFKDASEYAKRYYLNRYRKDFVVEIGSNDGAFLHNFLEYDHLGIEPSKSVTKDVKYNFINDYFSEEVAKEIVDKYGKARVIYSANVFPHMIERDSVMRGIKLLLHPRGVWINEEVSLSQTINFCRYDQFYNEHIFFSSLASFRMMLKLYDMVLIPNTTDINTHGGSTRFISTHSDNKVVGEVHEERIKKEDLTTIEPFEEFRIHVRNKAGEFFRIVERCWREYPSVVGYAATAKSSTVLNYMGISSGLIKRIYDTTPDKIGKYSPGMHIPIISYDEFKGEEKAVVLFAWNHANEIFKKEREAGREINWILPV